MKKVIWICGIAALILVLLAGVFTWNMLRNKEVAQQPDKYSLIKILKNPDDYDGKKVRVIAALKIEDRTALLYCTKSEMKLDWDVDWCYNESVVQPILLNDQQYEELKAFDNKYIIFNGRFYANRTNSYLHDGRIEDITDVAEVYGGMPVVE